MNKNLLSYFFRNKKAALIMLPFLLYSLFSMISISQAKETKPNQNAHQYAKAVLAGGCFWCTEADMEKVPGVIDVISGYAGGQTPNPTYEEVSSGTTGHIEVIEVTYDPTLLSYEELLDAFIRGIDPTDGLGSFVDRGPQYRPAIFFNNDEEKLTALRFIDEINEANIFPLPLKIELIPFKVFHTAEDYHQDYYQNNPLRYRYYRHGSGRDQYLDKIFGEERKTAPKTLRELINSKKQVTNTEPPKTLSLGDDPLTGQEASYHRPSDEEIKAMLSDIEYKVTQKEGTERPFDNSYWDHKEEGIYVDIVSGEPLFSSTDKYDSGTGWPSFTQPIDANFIVEKPDNTLFMKRTEIRSKIGDSHLGHVFDDGPAPTGLRYCMNSASLRFIPKEELAVKGYGKYLSLFEQTQSLN